MGMPQEHHHPHYYYLFLLLLFYYYYVILLLFNSLTEFLQTIIASKKLKREKYFVTKNQNLNRYVDHGKIKLTGNILYKKNKKNPPSCLVHSIFIFPAPSIIASYVFGYIKSSTFLAYPTFVHIHSYLASWHCIGTKDACLVPPALKTKGQGECSMA